MQRPGYSAIGKAVESLNGATVLHKLLWGCLAVAGIYVLLFGLAALITAIRWW